MGRPHPYLAQSRVLGVTGRGRWVSWESLADLALEMGGHLPLVSQVHGKQVTWIIPFLSKGDTETQKAPALLLGA